MALTITTTVGGELSNSYVDVAYADSYWENHFNATKAAQWVALSDEQKVQLLIQACMIIDLARFTEPIDGSSPYHLEYDALTQMLRSVKGDTDRPQRYFFYQNLQFPRTDTVRWGEETPEKSGNPFIPEEIRAAQCEQALYLLNFDESAIATALQGVKSESVSLGGISTSQSFGLRGNMYSPIAKAFVTPFLIKSSTRIQRA